jgi:hypothetical protein
VALNNVARTITGTRRRDHVKIVDLLAQAGLKSANRMVVKAIGAETWGCFHSDDGRNGARNHVGRLLFSDKRTATAKTTRSAKTGQIKVLLRGGRHLHHPRVPCGEQVGHAPPGDHEGEGKKSGIGLCKSHPALVLRDVTSLLRLVGCSLRVVGRLLRDVGRIPGDIGGVRQEVRCSVFFTVSTPSFSTEERKNCCFTRNKQDIV